MSAILLDVPAAEYHRRELGVVTNSVLKILRERTPAHYRAWVDDASIGKDTHALSFGRAYHCAILEPERFAATYAVAPDFGDFRTKQSRAARDVWQAENSGREMLLAEDAESINAMRAVLLSHRVAAGIIRTGHCEVTLRWMDDRTGLQCKARADWWVPEKFFMDLKTTEDASPATFARSIHTYGYHVQHAHYCDGARMLGETIKHYLILAQEKSPPYAVVVYHIDSHAEARGYELRARGMDTMRACLDTNVWPAYGHGINEIHLPDWALRD